MVTLVARPTKSVLTALSTCALLVTKVPPPYPICLLDGCVLETFENLQFVLEGSYSKQAIRVATELD